MNETEFVEKRRQRWDRLSYLARKADVTVQALNPAELVEFVSLYRSTCADLARVRGESSNYGLMVELNALVGLAYGVLYRRTRKSAKETVLEILLTVAQTFRKCKNFVLASLLITLLSGGVSFSLLSTRKDVRDQIIDAREVPLFKRWQEGKHDDRSGEENGLAWAFYASNNPRVSMIQTGVGLATGGLFSTMMAVNLGRQLGALSHEMAVVGKLGWFFSQIMPHGATELFGAIISGAAGLVLGWAIISPGRRTRLQALKEEGRDAMVLAGLSITMMFIAAPFEAFFSFNPQFPSWLKAIVGIIVLASWLMYFLTYGQKEEGRRG
ncbi:MAG: stage II sporulation protein M [Armatimonadetes bacterium]|nr:stage II sporulation protein M [Armatimonadota bacterium]